MSRALRYDPRISEATTQRVWEVARQVGYTPRDAKAPHAPEYCVEMVLFGLARPIESSLFFSEIYDSARTFLARQGIDLRVGGVNSRAEIPETYRRILSQTDVDGYLLGWDGITPEFARELTRREVPFVVIGADLPHVGVNLVGVDEFEGGYLATKHLIDRGRRRFAFIKGHEDHPSCNQKLAGCEAALAEAGLSLPPSRVRTGHWSVEGGYEAMKQILDVHTPDAVVTSHDGMALGAIRRAGECGLRVPEDVSITGYDDMHFAAYTTPSLTTVKTPRATIGKTAAELLMDLINGRSDRALKVVFRPELIVRESSGNPG